MSTQQKFSFSCRNRNDVVRICNEKKLSYDVAFLGRDMYISHSSKIPGQLRDELQWEEEKKKRLGLK